LSSWAFSFTNAPNMMKQFILLANWLLGSGFPSKHYAKSPLHWKCRLRLCKTSSTCLASSPWNAILTTVTCQVEKLGNSSGMNYKLFYRTYWNMLVLISVPFSSLAVL
jgi:hypothetical protein